LFCLSLTELKSFGDASLTTTCIFSLPNQTSPLYLSDSVPRCFPGFPFPISTPSPGFPSDSPLNNSPFIRFERGEFLEYLFLRRPCFGSFSLPPTRLRTHFILVSAPALNFAFSRQGFLGIPPKLWSILSIDPVFFPFPFECGAVVFALFYDLFGKLCQVIYQFLRSAMSSHSCFGLG